MATGTIFSPYPVTGTMTPFQVVRAKRAWTDPWTVIPWLQASSGNDGSAKSPANDMTFQWRFGNIIQPGTSIKEWCPWLNIAGCYVAVDVYDRYGGAGLWIGQVDEHAIMPYGSATVSAGIQDFKAIGLKQLLYQKPILGSYAQCYGGVAMIDEVIPFNYSDKDEKFAGLKGANMSPTPNADGVGYFYKGPTSGSDALNWTHFRAADYLLYYFANGEAVGGYAGPKFYLSGPDVLLEELDLMISTLKSDESVGVALDQFINEKRGMSWRIRTNGGAGDPVWVDLFSFFEEYNPDVVVLDTFDNRIQPNIQFNRTHSYDYVHVQGGPISICGTFSPGYASNGFCPLIPAWASALETEYEAIATDDDVADASRGAERYKSVFQRFQIPVDWDWYNVAFNMAPYPTDYATADPAYQSPQFMGSLRFQREIPVYENTDSAAEPELRKAFVLVSATDSEDNGPYWHYVEKLSKAGRNPASLSLSDDSLGIMVEPHLPHVGALNHSAVTNTLYKPEYDYETYLFTGMIKTNARLRCVIPVFNTTIPNEVPHVKVIEVPDAEMILIAPLTVTDIDRTDPSALVQTSAVTIFRDDTQRMIYNATLAARFYSQQQATARIVYKGILYNLWPGTIIAGLFTFEGFTAVGTVVLHRAWDFEKNETTITTGFLDIEADKGKVQRMQNGFGNVGPIASPMEGTAAWYANRAPMEGTAAGIAARGPREGEAGWYQ